MELIAKRLSPDHRQAVSAHYASMSYAPQGTTTRTPAPRLYVDGDAARGLVACAACHGFAGEGIGTANPPLGGQPRSEERRVGQECVSSVTSRWVAVPQKKNNNNQIQ